MIRYFARRLAVAAVALPVLAISATLLASAATTNRYGGSIYTGPPALGATAALVQAGGGAKHFSIAMALTSMIGAKMTDAEVAKLTKQYGKAEVAQWVKGFNYSIEDALVRATEAGVTLPTPPANLKGKELAGALVEAGVDPKTNVFWAGYMYDQTATHKIHNQVMDDMDAKYGATTDLITHKISNQAMYDLAQALGNTKVQLASLH